MDDPIELTVRASRALGAAGLSDMVWGHASVRDPDHRGVWMKAYGWGSPLRASGWDYLVRKADIEGAR